ncbi:MAG: 3-hydroxybutyryl-CoA dehydrogenase; 3-hydroxyacyl-CoA dehydrogenase [uncultured Rubrobacteraceae bacterium]|uniref:3-hydroxybutyryl-CoA dehydrogenase 3-hydroxyacyl-CoA dehydrogenase n=1 Tax=uncultured Rubrobacteraceae bacterium TaxID=349277 RepID=A0A6J4QGB2_9ACTN|nr:MAG: 3-hydroxybutyryl-CoA dehydrogenase; 3-hydroxyacyl-CoA dehydrogenase [uncultured Rubrobacteraceae bacterium]
MTVEKIAVVGAGVMGRGIAHAGALGGFDVRLHDVDGGTLKNATSGIEKEMKKAVEKGKLEEGEMHEALDRISTTEDLEEAVSGAGLVIEAVLEKMDLKLDLFKQFDGLCEPEAVLATNTSTMSPTEIAAATDRPGRCIAMHFFNPAHRMKLVELVRGVETTDETVETARNVAGRMGKETVEVNEFPGFVTSRINCLVGNEAMNMLVEGVASAPDIDKALKLGLGYPIGPLELVDLVGLDTRLRNLEYLHETLGEKYRPSPLLRKRVAAGHLGKKSGRGIYEYTEDGDVVR